MQLQIQPLPKDIPTSQCPTNFSIQASLNQAFQSSKPHSPQLSLLTQLRQIQLCANADFHYLSRLKTKCFRVLYEEDYEYQLEMISKGLISFKLCRLEGRVFKSREREFVLRLRRYLLVEKDKKVKNQKARGFYHCNLQRTILFELSSFIKMKKKSDTLLKILTKNKYLQVLTHFKQNLIQSRNKMILQQNEEFQINQIFMKRTCKKYFNEVKLFANYNKLEKILKKRVLKQFCVNFSQFQKQQERKLQKFKYMKIKRILARVFDIFKQIKLQSQSFDWYCFRLQKSYFNKWVKYLFLTKNQQQIEAYNEVIVQHFIDSKTTIQKSKIKQKYFAFWKSFTIFQKQQKKQSQILKSFAQLKEKEYLERKYFQILKGNRNFERSVRFFREKLKRKVLQGLKRNVIKQSKKLQNVYRFIRQRSIKKYFDRIHLFVQLQTKKIQSYRLQVAWSKFTFGITMQYFQNIQKARNYYETLLKFKALIAFKESVQISKKAQHCEQKLNVILPLKRWILRFRLKRLMEEKQYRILKRIIFQWKIVTLRKLLSSQKFMGDSQLFIDSRSRVKKRNQQVHAQSSIYSKIKKQVSQAHKQQSSFFKKITQNQSQSQDDNEVKRKVDAFLTKIKSKKNNAVKHTLGSSGQQYTNQKLIFANKSINRNYQHQTGERLRVPTWNSPSTTYKVSMFSQDFQDQ